jgi:SAM-dependent methyltransferase
MPNAGRPSPRFLRVTLAKTGSAEPSQIQEGHCAQRSSSTPSAILGLSFSCSGDREQLIDWQKQTVMSLATFELGAPEEVRPHVSCRICNSWQASPFLDADGYHIVRCVECGLRYLNPQPSNGELARFYSGFERERSWRGETEEKFDRVIRAMIERFQNSGTVLDIGSSKGNFLIAMRRKGFSVYGVEPSDKNSEFARAVHGIPTFNGTVEAFLSCSAAQQFSVITVLNVLEHLRDPREVVLRLRERLVEGGVLAVVVPDARFHAAIGMIRRLAGFPDPFWLNKRVLVGFDPPQHLCSFEPRTINLLVERCGFRTLMLRNAPVIFNQSILRDIAKISVHALGEFLYRISLGRLVVGYSTFLIARKVENR